MRVISGELKGRVIKGINITGTRPTMDRVKESMFAIIQNNIKSNICLDLFSGSGSLGIEAISNGAEFCYFIDNNKNSINIILENVSNLKIDSKCKIIKDDYNKALNDFKEKNIKFNVIFVDPPYNMHIINDIIKFISLNNLIYENGIIICEVDNLYLEDEIEDIVKYKEKKYGTTYLCFYKKRS